MCADPFTVTLSAHRAVPIFQARSYFRIMIEDCSAGATQLDKAPGIILRNGSVDRH
jgi:hypothetical protein